MIPQPIYELLPYLYMLVGLITLFSLDNILGKICGMVLLIVGVIVQQVRARARGRRPSRPKISGHDPQSGRPAANAGHDPQSGRPAANAGRDPQSGRLVANGREPVSRRSMPDRPSRRL